MVQQTGHHLFAGAGFAFDQNRGTRRRDLLDDLGNLGDFRRFADQAVELVGLFDLLGKLLVFRLQIAAAQGALEQHFDLVEIERLGDEVPGPAAHRLDGGVHRAVGGHHDGHRRLRQRERRVQQIHPGLAAHPQIGQQQLHRLALQNGHRLRRAGGGVNVELLLQRAAQAVTRGFLVVNNEQGGEHLGKS